MTEDGSIFFQLIVERLNYFIYIVLLMIGLWAMIAKNNLIKKLIGMSIFQTAIILFYVSTAVKEDATIPIYLPEHDPHGTELNSESNQSDETIHSPQVLDASLVSDYTNPLPHVLMLTAIVVGVATLGLALSVCLRIYRAYGTIEEDDLLLELEKEDARKAGGFRKKRPRRMPARGGKSKDKVSKGTEEKSKSRQVQKRRQQAGPSKAKSSKSNTSSDTQGVEKKKPTSRRRKPSPRKPREDKS